MPVSAAPSLELRTTPAVSALAPSRRLQHVDTIRGMLLVIMAVNHVPSPLHAVTDHPFGFMSAAEGFVFMAGLMAGLTYTRKWFRAGIEELKQSCVRRTVLIYRWHILMLVLVLGSLMLMGGITGIHPAHTPTALIERPAMFSLAAFTLVQQPPLFDVLPLYCAFIALTPWCLRRFARYGYATVVFSSLCIWAIANILCPQQPFIRGVVDTGAFNLFAWQFIFVAGLAFGHRWACRQAEASAAPLPPILSAPPPLGWALLGGVALLLFSVRHAFMPSFLPEPVLAALTNKNNLAPFRLLDTALILYFGYLVVTRFPRAFSWKPLALIGRSSLAAFAIHIPVAYFLQAHPELFAETNTGRWLSTLIILSALVLTALVYTRANASSQDHRDPARTKALSPTAQGILNSRPWIPSASPVRLASSSKSTN
jgi:Uncharacterized protein conserved in bacteria